jgi:nuclear pore complex protein Nup160
MYLQGRRFGAGGNSKVPAFQSSAMQARSYLASINALTLVDERNAWVAVPASSEKVRVSWAAKLVPYETEANDFIVA